MFEDSKFDWNTLKRSLGESHLDAEEKKHPGSIPLDEDDKNKLIDKMGQKIYEKLYYPKTAEEYEQKFAANIEDCYIKLGDTKPPPKLDLLFDTYRKMQAGIFKKVEFNCDRSAGFLFLADGKNNMIKDSTRVFEELDILQEQTDTLYENATSDNDKVRAALFQGLRWVSIHPANDGNKRMLKFIMNQAMSDLGLIPDIRHTWDDINPDLTKQALHGDNMSGLLKAVEQIYGVDLNVQEKEIPPFKIMPMSDHNKKLKIEDTRIHNSNTFIQNDEYIRFDKGQLESLNSKLGIFSIQAKKDFKKLEQPINSKDAMSILNKHQKKIDPDTLKNLRYITAVSQSGYKKYIEKAIISGELVDSIKLLDNSPEVRTLDNQTKNKLNEIFKESSKNLENIKTEVIEHIEKTVVNDSTRSM